MTPKQKKLLAQAAVLKKRAKSLERELTERRRRNLVLQAMLQTLIDRRKRLELLASGAAEGR